MIPRREVRLARPDDLADLPATERAADELFATHGTGPLLGLDDLGRRIVLRRLLS